MSERFCSRANVDQNLVESVKCAHFFHTKQAAERYCNPRKYFSSDEEFFKIIASSIKHKKTKSLPVTNWTATGPLFFRIFIA